MPVNRSLTMPNRFTPEPTIQIKCPKHHETPFQLVLRQLSTLFGFIGRVAFIAIFLTHFYFGKAYFLVAIPLLSMTSFACVFLAFRFKDWRFFMFVMSLEIISALGLFIIGVFLLVEITTQSKEHSSILLPGLVLRDVRAVCGILLIYPILQMSFLYVIYRGYQDHPLFPDFKPVTKDKTARRALLLYRSQKYLILLVLISLLALWAVLTSRLASLEQCGKPCPRGDSFFLDAKFGDQSNVQMEFERDYAEIDNMNLENVTFSFSSEENADGLNEFVDFY